MKTIEVSSVLCYYDGPQVLEAHDAIGGHYLAVIVEQRDKDDLYIVAGTPPDILRQLKLGLIDVRALLVDAPEWYMASFVEDQTTIALEPQDGKIREDLLPDDGFFIRGSESEGVLRQSIESNNVIVQITANPPEATKHRMKMDTLAGLLSAFQAVLKQSHLAARALMSESKRTFVPADAYEMDVVVPASPGSFCVTLEGAQRPDLFGQGTLIHALTNLDRILHCAHNFEDSLTVLKRIDRIRLTSAYLDLLSFLANHKTGLRYAWAEPTSTSENSSVVTESQAGSLAGYLSEAILVHRRFISMTGELDSVSRTRGTWGLLTKQIGIIYGDTDTTNQSLNGLVVGRSYTFHCSEDMLATVGTGARKRRFTLHRHDST